MDTFLKMDAFFVVATAASIVISPLVSVFLFYAIRLVRQGVRIASLVEREALLVKADVDDVRTTAKTEAKALLGLITIAREAMLRLVASRLPRE